MSEYRYMSISGRPRPVTATVTKPYWMEMSEGSSRRISFDSTGSTESLCSVLDHDSYISLSEDEDEPIGGEFSDMKLEEGPLYSTGEGTLESTEGSKEKIKQYRSHKSPSKNSYITPTKQQKPEDDEFQGMSPWEKWLLIKTREERIKQKLEFRNKKSKEEEQQKKENEKKEKLAKADEEIKKWKEHKREQEKIQKKMEKRLKDTEEDLKNQKESEIHEKAEKKYEEWLKTKKVEDRKRQKEERLKKKTKKELEAERKLKAEEKFKEWVKVAKKRPKTAGNVSSRNIATNSHPEFNSYPEPSFINKNAWQPITIPKQKSESKMNIAAKKNSKTRYVWNPDKYY